MLNTATCWSHSPLVDEPVNRYFAAGLHPDLVARVKINRTLGRWVGTFHQRYKADCPALAIVTYNIDGECKTCI
jgi:4-hydroxybutyryl-CoA dehydratase/vinylacetyl-CoA-Delta-isomerase